MTDERASPSTSVEIVLCAQHGLRYNALTQTGCVRCRKDSGEVEKIVRSASVRNQGLIAAALIVVTGTVFFGAHQSVVESSQAATPRDDVAISGGIGTDADVIMVILSDPVLMREIENDPALRRAFEQGDTDALRLHVEQYYDADPYRRNTGYGDYEYLEEYEELYEGDSTDTDRSDGG